MAFYKKKYIYITGRFELYNALVVPHFLAMIPIWNIFSESDKRQLYSDYYKYAKILLNLRPWTRNASVLRQFGIAEPIVALIRGQTEFLNSIESSSLAIVIRP